MTPDHERLRSSTGGTDLATLLRGHRLAAGYTQAELAARAGVGVRTVRDLERGRSCRPQRTTVDLLADALELTDGQRTAFLAAARGRMPAESPDGVAPPSVTPRPAAGNPASIGPLSTEHGPLRGLSADLPPPVDLIGREHDRTELARLFTRAPRTPVVSLVGLAGIGKSALALAVVRELADRFAGRLAGVPVRADTDPDGLLRAVAEAFGATGPAELVARLTGAPALLLVDGVDRAPTPVAEALDQLIRLLPELRVLTTGRHPLGLPGEQVWPVPPLDIPPDDRSAAGPQTLAGYPAVRMFTACLAQVRREPPTVRELPALTTLVRRLGGVPLAIELMAARGRVLDLHELLDRYGDRILDLPLPAQPGQPAPLTLRDMVAASYRLLTSDEQAALRRLAAFRHRWSVGLAEEMLAGECVEAAVDPVPLLDRLLELGLLTVRGGGPFRFRLLDAVREFAAEQLVAAGEATVVRRRHARIVLGMVARTEPELTGPGMVEALHRLDELTGDIAAALSHAGEDDPHTALRLATGLVRWLRLRGRDEAGRQCLRRLLADPRTADAEPALRASAALGLARLSAVHGGAEVDVPAARDALAVFRGLGDVAGELDARGVLGTLLTHVGAYEEAREQAEGALALAQRHDRIRDMAVAHRNLAWHDVRVGDLAAARRRLARVDRLAGQCGEQRIRMLARADLAELVRLEGRYADAVEQGRRAAAALAELGEAGHRRRALGTVGLAFAQAGRLDGAGEVLAELRATVPRRPGPVRPEDGCCALLEASIALRRGDRELAAEWFAVAAEAAGPGRRTVVEALVNLVVITGDATDLDRLEKVCREGGFRLLPPEEELLHARLADGADRGWSRVLGMVDPVR